jgi:hypothetical protein
MNKIARTGGAAMLGISLVAFSSQALSQAKPAPEPIKKDAPRAKRSSGPNILYTGDTLFARKVAGEGAENARLVVFSKSSGVKVKKNAFATCQGTGSISGRVDYVQGGKQKAKPFSVKFVPRQQVPKAPTFKLFVVPSSKLGLAEKEIAPRPELKPHYKAPNRDFFGLSPIPGSNSAVGAAFAYSFNVPYGGIAMANRWKFSNQMAFNLRMTIMASLRQRIEGNIYVYKTIPAISKDVVSATNFTLDLGFPFEWGTGNFSILAGPNISLFHRSGRIRTVMEYRNGFVVDGDAHSYSFWKINAGILAEVKVHVGEHFSVSCFYIPEYAFLAEGRAVARPDDAADEPPNFGRVGVLLLYKLSPTPRY